MRAPGGGIRWTLVRGEAPAASVGFRRMVGRFLRARRRSLAGADRYAFLAVSRWKSPVLDSVMPRLTRAADNAALWMVVAAAMSALPSRRAGTAARRGLASVAMTSFVANQVGKRLTNRSRPDRSSLPVVRRSLPVPSSSSFPSGHSASAAAFAVGVAIDDPAWAIRWAPWPEPSGCPVSTRACTIPATCWRARHSVLQSPVSVRLWFGRHGNVPVLISAAWSHCRHGPHLRQHGQHGQLSGVRRGSGEMGALDRQGAGLGRAANHVVRTGGEFLIIEIDGKQRTIVALFVGAGRYDPPGGAPARRDHLDSGVLDVRFVQVHDHRGRLHALSDLASRRGHLSSPCGRYERSGMDVTLIGQTLLARDGEVVLPTSSKVVLRIKPSALTVYRPTGS